MLRDYTSRFYFEKSITGSDVPGVLLVVWRHLNTCRTSAQTSIHMLLALFVLHCKINTHLADWHHHYIHLNVHPRSRKYQLMMSQSCFCLHDQHKHVNRKSSKSPPQRSKQIVCVFVSVSQSSFDWWTSRLTTCSSVRLLLFCWLMTI